MPEAEAIPDIADIAAPPAVADPLDPWVWGGIAGGLLLMGCLLLLVLHRRAHRRPPPASRPADALGAAMDTLHEVKENCTTLDPPAVAGRVVGALRNVLSQRFGLGSPSETADEFFARHGEELALAFNEEQRGQLADLLRSCDQLRYAPTPDSPSERLPLTERTLGFLRQLPAPRSAPPTDADSAAA